MGGTWAVVAPWIIHSSLWWSLLGLTVPLDLLMLRSELESCRAERVELAGTVSGKEKRNWGDGTEHCIRISNTEFSVGRTLYDWVMVGSEVVVEVRGGPRFEALVHSSYAERGTLIAIRRGKAVTAYQ